MASVPFGAQWRLPSEHWLFFMKKWDQSTSAREQLPRHSEFVLQNLSRAAQMPSGCMIPRFMSSFPRDISDRKTAERRLLGKTKALERRMEERTAAMIQASIIDKQAEVEVLKALAREKAAALMSETVPALAWVCCW